MAKRRPHLKRPIPIGEVLLETKATKRGARLVELYRVQKAWNDSVGPMLSDRTFPKRIRGSILIVATENAAWAHQLSMMREEVLKILTAKSGVSFSDIRFVSEPLRKMTFSKRTVDVADEAPVSARPAEGVQDPELAEILGRMKSRIERLRLLHRDEKR